MSLPRGSQTVNDTTNEIAHRIFNLMTQCYLIDNLKRASFLSHPVHIAIEPYLP